MNNKFVASRSIHSFVCIFYGAMLILGLMLKVMPGFLATSLISVGLISDVAVAEHIVRMFGIMLCSLMPTLGFYLAFRSPYELPRGARVALTVGTVFAMLGGLINYVIAMERVDFSISGSEFVIFFQLTLVFSYITTVINHFILSAAPKERIITSKNEEGVINKAFGAAGNVINSIMNFKDKHSNAYFVISTVFTTLFAIVTLGIILLFISLVMGICMIVIVGSIVIGMIMNSSSDSSSGSSSGSGYGSSEEKVYEVNEDGWTRTLTFHSREYSIGGERYRDDRGDYWLTEDGGKTFYREK